MVEKEKDKNYVAMFEKLPSILVIGGEEQVIAESTKNEILPYLIALENECSTILLKSLMKNWIKYTNPFKLSVEKFLIIVQMTFWR